MTVNVYPEHVAALERGLAALKAERATLEKWAIHSVELALAIDDYTELLELVTAEQKAVRDSITTKTAYPTLRAVS